MSVSLVESFVCVQLEFDGKFGLCLVQFWLGGWFGFRSCVVESPVCVVWDWLEVQLAFSSTLIGGIVCVQFEFGLEFSLS